MESCPKELEPYNLAHRKKIEEQDILQHMWWGNYGISAFIVAIDSCMNGTKAKSEYIKKPIFEDIEERNKPLTEEELQRQRELFVAKLEVMKTNFELNHKVQ